MHSVIVGCGRVGSEVADALEYHGYSVSIIDKDPRAFESLREGFTGRTFTGVGFDKEILEAAGIKDAQVFAAVTNGDNSNIVAARIAREHYQIPKVVARIYDPRRAEIYERLGIPTVATVAWATDQVLSRLLPAAGTIEWTVATGEVVVVAAVPTATLIGRPVLSLEEAGKIRVLAISRFGSSLIPDTKSLIQDGDLLHVSVLRSALEELHAKLGTSP